LNDADSLTPSRTARWTSLIAPALLLAVLLLVHGAALWALSRWGLVGDVAVRIIETAAWLSGTWLVVRVIDIVLWERLVPWWIGMRAPGLLRQFIAVLVFAVGMAVMLRQSWDLALSAVLATTGVLGIVLGLAMRGILADFFSGIALNIEKPFDLGDFVSIRVRGQREPFYGLVRELTWRSTRLLTPEDNLVSLPNAVVAAAIVENLSYPSPVSELEADLTLDWDVDQVVAERVLTAAATEAWALGATAGDKPPKVRICRIDGAGVTWRIVYLLDPRKRAKGPARHILLRCVHKHLVMAGLQPAALPGSAAVLGAVLASSAAPETPAPSAASATGALDHGAATDRLKVLATVELLRGLTAEERRSLAEVLVLKRAAAGQPVVQHGEPGDSMFVVVEGALGVHVPGPSEAQRANVLGPGSVFGEMAMLTGEARSATVKALGPVLLYEIGHEQMAPVLARRPGLADVLAELMTQHQQRDAATLEAALNDKPAVPGPRGVAQQLASRIRAWLGARA